MFEKLCARDWIRTSTPFPAPPPQGGASTNFATRASIEFANVKDYFLNTILNVVPFPGSDCFTNNSPL